MKLPLEKGLWVKSPDELELEAKGFRLFGNADVMYGNVFRQMRDMEAMVKEFCEENNLPEETYVHLKAYDNYTCRLPEGRSLYMKAPELITPGPIVHRDLYLMIDKPYKGDDIEEIVEHTDKCRISNEESLKEVYGL
jgi:hypothetical protein